MPGTHTQAELTELPFGLAGRVFRSPMPFSRQDPFQRIFEQYSQVHIDTILLLASDDECQCNAGRNLREFYIEQGLEVIYLPIPDFGIPDSTKLNQAIRAALARVEAGKNLALHCYAGLGRTGMVAACMAKCTFGFTGEEAVAWVRACLPKAIETVEQEKIVQSF